MSTSTTRPPCHPTSPNGLQKTLYDGAMIGHQTFMILNVKVQQTPPHGCHLSENSESGESDLRLLATEIPWNSLHGSAADRMGASIEQREARASTRPTNYTAWVLSYLVHHTTLTELYCSFSLFSLLGGHMTGTCTSSELVCVPSVVAPGP